MSRLLASFAVVLLAFAAFAPLSPAAPEPAAPDANKDDAKITEGRLDAIGPDGKSLGPCPLKHTDVKVNIAGYVTHVTVTQQFHNPFKDKIEAVYVFPMHQAAAVDAMTMTIGDRLVRGVIKERGEAKAIYEAAKERGNVAALLDQERPNIFTQSVANIEPGEKVTIEIRYSQTLDYSDGRFRFDFPMVVGPRYIPGGSQGNVQPGPGPNPAGEKQPQPALGVEQAERERRDIAKPQAANGGPPVHNPLPGAPTEQVPDADRITPPVVKEGHRAGHDIAVTVYIDAGCTITDIASDQHAVDIAYTVDNRSRAKVTLKDQATIPNKDFVLSYAVTTDGIGDAILTHTDERGRFFTLVLHPPTRVVPADIVPRELVFVLDTSGSMNGFPMETSKAMMRKAIANLRPKDTFNIVTFAGSTSVLFDKPVANNPENRAKATQFIDTLQGAGGTEMMAAINLALGGDHDPASVRIVCFLTDGYVGNDMAIIDAIQKNAATTRVFSFGIGRSVNRYLMDGMATAGRGEATYVLDDTQAARSADTFYERIDAPVLTDISLDFAGLPVEEVYPNPTAGIPDLFAAKPVVIKGRYTQAASGAITLRGKTAGGAFERRIDVSLPGVDPTNSVLAPQWARAKVEHLMNKNLGDAQRQMIDDAARNQIIAIGVEYSLLTQYTSFVAVEELRITEGGKARTIRVPVEMPEGVSHEGVFGEQQMMQNRRMALAGQALSVQGTRFSIQGGGSGAASGKPQTAPSTPAPSPILRDSAKRIDKADTEEAAPAKPLTEAEQRDHTIKSKLDAKLLELIKTKSTDRVEVRITLADLSDATLAKLKELGFTELARTKSVNMLIGTIGADKLEALALLDPVRRIDRSE